MLPEIEQIPMPDWLLNIGEFNIYEVLKDSLYYPACCIDGKPIKHLMGNVYSFIYVDHWTRQSSLNEHLNSRGIKGYNLIHKEAITMEQLTPKGWKVVIPPRQDEYVYNSVDNNNAPPFCEWYIFERKTEYDETHNPKRFSLLYLCADGAASYQALYLSNNISPKFLCLVNPGWWCDFDRRSSLLYRSVAKSEIKPKFMLTAYNHAPWLPDYAVEIPITSRKTFLNLWKRCEVDI